MIEIKIFDFAGDFAEDKDVAKDIRIKKINKALRVKQKVVIDFENVSAATQSFIHALISDVIRKNGIKVLDKIEFKNCNSKVKTIIQVVVEYIQDGIFTEG